MSDFMIINRGGGVNGFAVIAVTYPAGSVCTCTNGTRTLRAKGTGGSYFFQIPSAGTWTVSCTDGVDTDSKSVAITTQYQSENIALGYTDWLYKDGDNIAPLVMGRGGTSYVIFNANSILLTHNANNDSSASVTTQPSHMITKGTLKIRATGTGVLFVDTISNRNPYNATWVASVPITGANNSIISLDVSSLIGQSYYIGAGVYFSQTLTVYQMWLE